MGRRGRVKPNVKKLILRPILSWLWWMPVFLAVSRRRGGWWQRIEKRDEQLYALPGRLSMCRQQGKRRMKKTEGGKMEIGGERGVGRWDNVLCFEAPVNTCLPNIQPAMGGEWWWKKRRHREWMTKVKVVRFLWEWEERGNEIKSASRLQLKIHLFTYSFHFNVSKRRLANQMPPQLYGIMSPGFSVDKDFTSLVHSRH